MFRRLFVTKVVDPAPSTFNVDAEQVKARISKDVRRLLVTHAVGEPVDLPAKGYVIKKWTYLHKRF